MQTHFGHPRRTRRKVHQHRVGQRIGNALQFGRGSGDFRAQVEHPLRHTVAHDGDGAERFTLGTGRSDIADQFGLIHRKDHPHLRQIAAVDNVLDGKLIGGGDTNRADFAERKDADPRLGTLLEHHHHAVALSDARAKKEVGAAIAKLTQIAEGVHPAVAVVGTPEQRVFRRVLHGPFVYYVIGKIEAGRNANLIVRLQVLVGFKFRAFEKFF